MSDQSDREKTLDPNFVETIELLNANKIPYWVCHGSLLGLIRDGQLIPWDHDIDVAVWNDEISKDTLIDLMTKSGYSVKHRGSGYDFVAFMKSGGREVDFNFYRISSDPKIAFSEWFIPNSKVLTAIELISLKKKSDGKFSRLLSAMFFLSPLAKLIVFLSKKTGIFYSSAGYTTPTMLLKDFAYIDVLGSKIRIPSRSHDILAFIYGKDWNIPKKTYDWVKESPATVVSHSRFKSME